MNANHDEPTSPADRLLEAALEQEHTAPDPAQPAATQLDSADQHLGRRLAPESPAVARRRRRWVTSGLWAGSLSLATCFVLVACCSTMFQPTVERPSDQPSTKRAADSTPRPPAPARGSATSALERSTIINGLDHLAQLERGSDSRSAHVTTWEWPTVEPYRTVTGITSYSGHIAHGSNIEVRPTTHFGDGELKLLCDAIGGVQRLVLSKCDITDAGLAELHRLPCLTSLGLPDCPRITDEGMKTLAKMTDLVELDLSGWVGQISMGPEPLPENYVEPFSKLTDAGFEHLKSLTKLKRLDLSGTNVTVSGLLSLGLEGGIQQLESLNIHYAAARFHVLFDRISVGVPPYWFPNLRELTFGLDGDPESDQVLYQLASLQNLQSLAIKSNTMDLGRLREGYGVRQLAGAKNLKHLHLERCFFENGNSLAHLLDTGSIPSAIALDSLTLDMCRGFDDAALKSLTDATNLKPLQTLRLTGMSSLTDTGYETLRYTKITKVLDLTGSTAISPTNLAAIRKALPDVKITGPHGSLVPMQYVRFSPGKALAAQSELCVVVLDAAERNVVAICEKRTEVQSESVAPRGVTPAARQSDRELASVWFYDSPELAPGQYVALALCETFEATETPFEIVAGQRTDVTINTRPAGMKLWQPRPEHTGPYFGAPLGYGRKRGSNADVLSEILLKAGTEALYRFDVRGWITEPSLSSSLPRPDPVVFICSQAQGGVALSDTLLLDGGWSNPNEPHVSAHHTAARTPPPGTYWARAYVPGKPIAAVQFTVTGDPDKDAVPTTINLEPAKK